jgi:hypothetical protein
MMSRRQKSLVRSLDAPKLRTGHSSAKIRILDKSEIYAI